MVVGLLLAAGAGRRYGMPKALVGDGAWLRRSVAVLFDGGCEQVVVVVGAEADRVARLVPPPARTVVAEDWAAGMGSSLRAGLHALTDELATLADHPATAALIHLVDLPDVGHEVVRRVVGHATPDVVARATYQDLPGHPVLLGARHWPEVADAVTGDQGARGWLAGRDDIVQVECEDLATGRDIDVATP